MNQIKAIFQSYKKKTLLTLLRIVSIVLGIGVTLYIFELNHYEKSYDSSWKNADNIYRVALIHEENGEQITHSAKNFLGTAALLKAEVPSVEAACGFNKDKINIFCDEQQFSDVNWLWADTSIIEVFQMQIVKSESNDIWNDIHSAIISESYAHKLFGSTNPINQKFKLNEGWEFRVKAVFEDIPNNSHLAIDFVASRASLFYYMNHFDYQKREMVENSSFDYGGINPYVRWSWNTPYTYRRYNYIRLNDGASINGVKRGMAHALAKVEMPPKYSDSTIKFDFQPIKEIYLKSQLEQEFKPNGSAKRVLFLYIIASIILLVSFINFLNLTNIQTIENGKSFAIHTLNGAQRSSVFSALLWDSLIINIISGSLGIFVIYLFRVKLLPAGHISLQNLIIVFAGLILLSGFSVITSYYRSLHGKLSNYLKSNSGVLSGNKVGQKILIFIQFSIAIILISGMLIIGRQLKFMSEYSLGFKPQQTMFSYSPMTMNLSPETATRLDAFKNEIMQISGVNEFSVSSSVPGNSINRISDNVRLENDAKSLAKSFSVMSTSNNYFQLFNIEMLAGRDFNTQASWQSNEVVINQTGITALGINSPAEAIGKYIIIGEKQFPIVGVISDYNHTSLKHVIQPLVIHQNLSWDFSVGYYCIGFDAKSTSRVLQSVSEVWERIYPGEVANFQFTDDTFNAQYTEEKKFQNITNYGSWLALFISCIGLFAIAAFDTKKRIKEIGVRKVNGATVSEILIMLNKDFIKWVALAFIIACPIAYYAMDRWLENFAYKTELSWWIFALAGLVAINIALLTVSFQSWRAARQNPIESLRSE